jgi:exosortase/archaeosortase family protein
LRIAAFLLCFAALQLGWQALRGSALQQAAVHAGLLRPAAWLVNRVSPGAGARAEGNALRGSRGGINLLNGCEGVEAQFLLWSACAVSSRRPARPWRAIVLGSALLHGLNVARIAGLFLAYSADPGLFDLLHSSVMPVVLVLAAALCFFAWTGSNAHRVATPA